MRLYRLASCIALLILSVACKKSDLPDSETSADSVSMTKNDFVSTSHGYIGYWLYTPASARADMPLIVYLHGGSGRGNDLKAVVAGSLPKFLYEGSVANVPAFVLMPQCPEGKTWEQIASSVMELIDKICTEHRIDRGKIGLTGHSLGGSGTWRLGASYPQIFCCLAPLSGSADLHSASAYTGLPVWAFVGSADDIVSPNSSEAVVAMIRQLGGEAQLTVFQGATHFDVPDLVYKNPQIGLLNWMINQTKK